MHCGWLNSGEDAVVGGKHYFGFSPPAKIPLPEEIATPIRFSSQGKQLFCQDKIKKT
jgi:hypothetical protein